MKKQEDYFPCRKCCGNCLHYVPGCHQDDAGECRDAIKRAREVVPFAINLEVSRVYPHGGKDCPCFKEKP